jgi:hypothetical protein
MATTMEPTEESPAVDDRLVMPGTRYEIEDGRLLYVPPALECSSPWICSRG